MKQPLRFYALLWFSLVVHTALGQSSSLSSVRLHQVQAKLIDGSIVTDGLYCVTDTALILVDAYRMTRYTSTGEGEVPLRYIPNGNIRKVRFMRRGNAIAGTLIGPTVGLVAFVGVLTSGIGRTNEPFLSRNWSPAGFLTRFGLGSMAFGVCSIIGIGIDLESYKQNGRWFTLDQAGPRSTLTESSILFQLLKKDYRNRTMQRIDKHKKGCFRTTVVLWLILCSIGGIARAQPGPERSVLSRKLTVKYWFSKNTKAKATLYAVSKTHLWVVNHRSVLFGAGTLQPGEQPWAIPIKHLERAVIVDRRPVSYVLTLGYLATIVLNVATDGNPAIFETPLPLMMMLVPAIALTKRDRIAKGAVRDWNKLVRHLSPGKIVESMPDDQPEQRLPEEKIKVESQPGTADSTQTSLPAMVQPLPENPPRTPLIFPVPPSARKK